MSGPRLTGRGALLSPGELAKRLGEQHPPTPEQDEAIATGLHPLVVVAGAGSGKTQTMGLRVVWLVANGLVEPHRVLGLTFTRKAAAELGERVRRMLRSLRAAHEQSPFLADPVVAALAAGEPTVSTYNAYAGALVSEHALRVGLEPSMRLIGTAMSWQQAAEVVSSYDGSVGTDRALSSVIGDVLALAGELAEHLRDPGEVVDLTTAIRDHVLGLPRAPGQRGGGQPANVAELLARLDHRLDLLPMVDRYVRRKRDRGVLDFGDQVELAARIAGSHPEVAAIEQSRFGAVLLDEYQDTGEAQRVLLTSLFAGHPVTAVGDPRQSIYGWRGASAGNLERFLDDFVPGSGPRQQCSLSRSFRNPAAVLAVANSLAADIPLRGLDDRPLVPGLPGAPGTVVVALHRTVTDEADWVAERVAALGVGSGDRPSVPWGEVVVLARRRSQFPRIEEALRARHVPCEVLGLGGLLLEPEVVDVVSTLRVLSDPLAGAALVRLLAGPRWRIGPRDLDALGRRARQLAVPPPWAGGGGSGGRGGDGADGRGGDGAGGRGGDGAVGRGGTNAEPDYDAVDERSLIDALDDLGEPRHYSAEGHHRLVRLRDELRGLRERVGQPLPELVLSVAAALCLDVELAARPGARSADAMRSIHRFVEVAEEFAALDEDSGLLAFLGYLDTAEVRERGLELDRADDAEADAERVQLMTVHAAKGLEWDAVFVVGMTSSVFPVEGQAVSNWTRQIAALPFPLRGDRRELPELRWPAFADQKEAREGLAEFADACKRRSLLEEQRLAYVAVTRARRLLACSGYWWDAGAKKKRGPSTLLQSVRDVCAAGHGMVELWAEEPGDEETNPVLGEPVSRPWPYDPLGARRPRVEAAAALVNAALAEAAAGPAGLSAGVPEDPPQNAPFDDALLDDESPDDALLDDESPDDESPDDEWFDGVLFDDAGDVPTALDPVVADWREETDVLLAELARHRQRRGRAVELPHALSVSQLVELRRDPAELARRIRRPLPRRPAPEARRGTRFHSWLEQRWGQQRLLDIDELPGAADETAPADADLMALQDAFRDSEWWARVPAEVEFPFDLVVDGVLLRGRCDAVFTDAPDGLVDVIDWKTGRPPSGADAEAAGVQLAVYRLAWHHLTGTPLDRIRAAFHYVSGGRTVRATDLLDHDALVALIRSVPLADCPPSTVPPRPGAAAPQPGSTAGRLRRAGSAAPGRGPAPPRWPQRRLRR